MYKIFFNDNTIFENKRDFQSKWRESSNEPITAIEHSLKGIKCRLEGFESYNFLIVREHKLSESFLQKSIAFVILMGLYQNKVYEVIYDLKKQRVYRWVANFGEEYGNEAIIEKNIFKGWKVFMPTAGWKEGQATSKPKITRL